MGVWGEAGVGVGGEMGKAMVTSENPRQSVENRPTAPNVVRLLASSPKSNRPPAQKTSLGNLLQNRTPLQNPPT